MLVETDLSLRSSTEAPQMAMMERTLIRLAMLPGRGAR
jgi:DNA polymerase-3 subunit delta